MSDLPSLGEVLASMEPGETREVAPGVTVYKPLDDDDPALERD